MNENLKNENFQNEKQNDDFCECNHVHDENCNHDEHDHNEQKKTNEKSKADIEKELENCENN